MNQFFLNAFILLFILVLSLIWSLSSPAGATADECHCPGEVAFTQIVQDAWFNVKHNQTWQLSTVGGERGIFKTNI